MSMSLQPVYVNDDSHKYNSPLVDAAYNGDVDALKFLLTKKWDPDIDNYKGMTPLMATMEMAYCGRAEMLLDAGADINKAKWNDEQPIWYAVQSGAECVRLLLARGADPNGGLEEKGPAPLAVAKDAETARLLIAAVAIVDLPDYKNYTPLCHAILKGKKGTGQGVAGCRR